LSQYQHNIENTAASTGVNNQTQQVYTNASAKVAIPSPGSGKQGLTNSLNLQQQILMAQQVQQNLLHPKVSKQAASFSGGHAN